jgi:hypothetical protein
LIAAHPDIGEKVQVVFVREFLIWRGIIKPHHFPLLAVTHGARFIEPSGFKDFFG